MSEAIAILEKYQSKIHAAMAQAVDRMQGPELLCASVKYALMNGGKKLRPIITLMVAEALANGQRASEEQVLPAALAIEYFHTASLVADDLPCMDDDDQRRSKPSVHKVYGESLALLTSYALIAAGFNAIAESANKVAQSHLPYAFKGASLGIQALDNASFNTGLLGATGGQLLDLSPPNLSLPTLKDVVQRKTASLFEVAFVFGWLFGGGNEELLPQVKQAASCFGLAFQIADDLGDMEQDRHNGRTVNLATVLGETASKKMLNEQIASYRRSLRYLNIDSVPLLFLADQLLEKSS